MSYPNHVPDHPVIRNCERTGWPDGKEPEYPKCPICGRDGAPDVYLDKDRDIVGCTDCLTRKDADDLPQCRVPGREYPLCPVCRQPCEDVYLDASGRVVGCGECLRPKDMWDCPECFPEKE